jgi:seryl-tRNA synthetase
LTYCSNTTDYQARRLRCRYRPGEGSSPRPVHTLNGTAVAVGRTIVAIMENFQDRDGGVDVPEALAAYGAPPRLHALS